MKKVDTYLLLKYFRNLLKVAAAIVIVVISGLVGSRLGRKT